jgi:magnesium-transporting ATPase (P-type)
MGLCLSGSCCLCTYVSVAPRCAQLDCVQLDHGSSVNGGLSKGRWRPARSMSRSRSKESSLITRLRRLADQWLAFMDCFKIGMLERDPLQTDRRHASPAQGIINGLTKHDWLEALLFAVAVAVGLTPEMLPMIVTVNLAKGAIAMAREKVIVKRLTAIQNIGAVNVLCADKTGTLRQDRITRYRLGWPSVKNRIGELPEERATACPNHHADCISANDIGAHEAHVGKVE